MARISLFPKAVKEPTAFPEPPADWMGSRPEWAIFWALLRLGYKDRFTYQSAKMGGRLARGGAVIDFEIPELNLGINVQSIYYHYRTTALKVAGELQRAQLESQGTRLIFISEENALRDPIYYTKEALSFREH